MNRRNIKRFLTDHVAAVVLILIALATFVVIKRVDSKTSRDETKEYAPKDTKADEDERMFIPVPYTTFADLVEFFKTANHVDMQGMGSPEYNEKDGQTTIDVSDMSKSGLSLLTGTSLGTTTWCTGTLCSFETNKIDTVVVVRCPVALMVRLVGSKEKH